MHRLLTLACAAVSVGAACVRGAPKPDKDGKYWLYGDGVRAGFIAYGASLSDFIIKDKNGVERDVTAGFDNATYYGIDRQHNHFGGIVGRYANRIKNSTFEIDGVDYHVTPNEHNGQNQLHGGPDGWDWRNFTVDAYSNSSITFSLIDPDGKEGFPGEVRAWVTYSLYGKTWDIQIVAIPTNKPTPIHLAQHGYWNLDGFANTETNLIFNHSFFLPYGGQRVDVDPILIPTGNILANQPGSVNDFWSKPKQIGHDFGNPDLKGNCGDNCTGYDTCWLTNRAQNGPYDWEENYVARLSSPWSGIQLDIYTDQDAFQMYSCNFQNGSVALKKTQGLHDGKFPRTIPQYGCLVLETEDWIDAINQPEWQREKKHIYRPGGHPYVHQSKYVFSINATAA